MVFAGAGVQDDAMSRLSTIDSSFLRIESGSAHMHVGWVSVLELPAEADRFDRVELTRRVAARLHLVPRFRQRVTRVPFGVGEPVWCDDPGFDVRNHVRELPPRFGGLGLRQCTNLFFSRPLRRDRPLWEIALIPRLADGHAAILGKIHHAMVDGVAAVELGMLLFDASADAEVPAPVPWRAASEQARARIVLDALADTTVQRFRATGRMVGLARSPRSAARAVGTVGRGALSIAQDALNPAPVSHLNVDIGPARTVVTHTIVLARLLSLKQRCAVTLNDVVLAVCAGALRKFAIACGVAAVDLRVMVPVNVRRPGEQAAAGNRVAFGLIELPVASGSATERMRCVVEAMGALKHDGRIPGSSALLAAAGVLPDPLKTRAARMASSPRLYNLIVSNVPGPRTPLYACGSRVRSIHPVVPIPDRHALSIGVLTYDQAAHFSCYADPQALPLVEDLAIAIEDSLVELEVALRAAGGARWTSVHSRSRPGPCRHMPHGRARQPLDQVS
jgi:diacylglycerol O-acyltransferase / wax synthase